MSLYCAGLVLPVTVLFVKSMEVFSDLRGSASALGQAIRMLMMGMGLSMAGMTYDGTYGPVGYLTGIAVVIAFVFMLPFLKPGTDQKQIAIAAMH